MIHTTDKTGNRKEDAQRMAIGYTRSADSTLESPHAKGCQFFRVCHMQSKQQTSKVMETEQKTVEIPKCVYNLNNLSRKHHVSFLSNAPKADVISRSGEWTKQ